jgi:hypothetical protein
VPTFLRRAEAVMERWLKPLRQLALLRVRLV